MLYKNIRIITLMKLYNTFITKYKPYSINNFTNDIHFLDIVSNLIELDNLNILFVGNICSGKTTLLNCVAREYYGLSGTDSIPENNTLCINNLKEQGIQYFRNEMKTFCQSRSAIHGKKKIVLIDDIDSINEQSQQVFRNYIDKYSKNIQFISVCSNIQKVIESLQSRLHIVSIPKHTNEYMISTMNKIITLEDMQIKQEIKDYIMHISNGSIRILINHLEKIFIYGKDLDLNNCMKLCSTISFQHFDRYYESIKDKQLDKAIHVLYEIYDYGYSVIDILDYLFHYTKTCKALSEEIIYEIIILLCKYITVFHNIHEDCIELALITNNIYTLINSQ
jgi:DNA polymerase III subunit gamma/tau